METIVDWQLSTLLLTWVGLNMLASFFVLRNPELPSNKRLLQLVIVWLLPVIGAVLCLAFVVTETRERTSAPDKTAFADNADASGAGIAMPPGSGICGCSGSDGGGDGGD